MLRHREFRLLWAGETVSNLGNSMSAAALPLVLVTVLHAGTFTLGLFTFTAYLPWLLVGLPAGAVIDRLPVRRLMIAVDIVSAVLYAVIPVAATAGMLTTGVVMVIVFGAGTANVIFTNAFQVLVPSLAPGRLVSANAWLSGSSSAAEVAGPGLSGLIAGTVGATCALAADAATFLVSAACLTRIRASRPCPEGQPEPGRADGFRRRTTGGLRFIARDPYLRPLTSWAAAVNLGLGGYDALIVAYLIRDVGVGPGTVGVLIAVTSLGSVLAAVTAAPLVRRAGSARAAMIAGVCAMPFTLLIPFTGRGAGLAFFVVGRAMTLFGVVTMNVIQPSFRQSYVPAGMLGMVTAAARFAVLSAYPVGGLLGGALGAWLGLRASLWTALGIVTGSGVLLVASPVHGRRDLPAAQSGSLPGGRPTGS